MKSSLAAIAICTLITITACTEEEDPVGFIDSPTATAQTQNQAPLQILYETQNETQCIQLIIEPSARQVQFTDECDPAALAQTANLNSTEADEIVRAVETIEETCPGDCEADEEVEVLTEAQMVKVLPLRSPLREQINDLISRFQDEEPEPTPTPQVSGSFTVTLHNEEGLVFHSKETLAKASPLKADLIAYASAGSIDMQAGAGPSIAHQENLRLFRTPGGTVEHFSSIDDLPHIAPSDTDRDMIRKAEVGMGFAVENNLSDGYTRVFVKAVSHNSVTLVCEID